MEEKRSCFSEKLEWRQRIVTKKPYSNDDDYGEKEKETSSTSIIADKGSAGMKEKKELERFISPPFPLIPQNLFQNLNYPFTNANATAGGGPLEESDFFKVTLLLLFSLTIRIVFFFFSF